MPEAKLQYRLKGTDWTDRNRFECFRETLGRAVMKLEIEPFRRDSDQC